MFLASQFSLLTAKPDPVVYGYWGKDESVPAERDFLWVKGRIKSNNPDSNAAELKFMLDTGSEVMTCDNNVVKQLGLEYIKTIISKGIHKEEERPIYRGTLLLGDQELEVEVGWGISELSNFLIC